jgi:hypothetical protein
MALSFFPAQKIEIGGTRIPLVQNGSLKLNVTKKSLYGLDKLTSYKTIQTEPTTASINFSYILSNELLGSTLGISNLNTTFSDMEVGKVCKIYAAGTYTINKSFLTSYNVQGSIGSPVKCDVEYQGYDISFSSPEALLSPNTYTYNVVPPDKITLNVGGILTCRSFNFKLSCVRENSLKLGELLPVASILTRSPSIEVEAEVILNTDDIDLIPNTNYNISINCNGTIYSIQNIKLNNISINSSTTEVATAVINFDKELEDFTEVSIGG